LETKPHEQNFIAASSVQIAEIKKKRQYSSVTAMLAQLNLASFTAEKCIQLNIEAAKPDQINITGERTISVLIHFAQNTCHITQLEPLLTSIQNQLQSYPGTMVCKNLVHHDNS
jgi:hypothetical protein